MNALAHMPPAERFAHGTRARYCTGCRCGDCRGANLAAYHVRQHAIDEAARSVVPTGPALDGTILRGGRAYRVKLCPGAGGAKCVQGGAWLRGAAVCRACIARATVWNGLVDAKRARAHLRRLSRQGVGYKTVADAAVVSPTIVAKILNGKKHSVRADTERRILDVTVDARADKALVDAGPTWKLIDRMLAPEVGFSKAELAHRLGYARAALQLRRDRITLRNAERVRKFYEAVML